MSSNMDKIIHIADMDIKYQLDYRDILYPRLEFKTGDLLLVLPKNYEDEEDLINKHKGWIVKKRNEIIEALQKTNNRKLVKTRDKEAFKEYVIKIAEQYSEELHLNAKSIVFKKMKSKWASCSSKKNLTVNTLLRYLPNDLIKYVIFHEITHLIEREHNEKFWRKITQKFKKHNTYEKDLLVYWFLVQNENYIKKSEYT